MTLSQPVIWLIIIVLGVGTFALRFSFLGLLGSRPLPPWALRLLRYTPVAVLPGLIAPRVFLPPEGATSPDPTLVATALVTLALGVWTKSAIWAMLSGALTLTVLTLILA
ncbi:AzlD domain-containing protein [Pararhodobacter marinus]|uniref:AzlD domain-containing protein n=1 Tax=Pararhodobacter marinus TaxID=2184063 RepID=A0A2U2C5T7_9RHOB|nr:AzlD domain-containing protein [Pararhodobacter marinus]PWE27222.1 AzlD domain-containing protein [Pararhodobacter marinus]